LDHLDFLGSREHQDQSGVQDCLEIQAHKVLSVSEELQERVVHWDLLGVLVALAKLDFQEAKASRALLD